MDKKIDVALKVAENKVVEANYVIDGKRYNSEVIGLLITWFVNDMYDDFDFSYKSDGSMVVKYKDVSFDVGVDERVSKNVIGMDSCEAIKAIEELIDVVKNKIGEILNSEKIVKITLN